jgi:hypothetical protein
VVGGSKLNSGRMFLHMSARYQKTLDRPFAPLYI